MTLPSRYAIHKMVSHGRSASPIHFASLRYSGRSHASRAYHASFCSLFDPRFRFAPPRTAGAKLFASIKEKAFGCAHFMAPLCKGSCHRQVTEGLSVQRAAGVVSPYRTHL